MNREDILHMIDTITHPANMGSDEAVEFLEKIGQAVHQRQLNLLHEFATKEKK